MSQLTNIERGLPEKRGLDNLQTSGRTSQKRGGGVFEGEGVVSPMQNMMYMLQRA